MGSGFVYTVIFYGLYPWDASPRNHHQFGIIFGIQPFFKRRKFPAGLRCFVTGRWSKNVWRVGLEVRRPLKKQFVLKSWRLWRWFWVKGSLQIDGFLVWLLHSFGLSWTFQPALVIGSLFLPNFGGISPWTICLRVWWYGWWRCQASKMFWSWFASSHVRKAELSALRYSRIGWLSSQLPLCLVSSLVSMSLLAF